MIFKTTNCLHLIFVCRCWILFEGHKGPSGGGSLTEFGGLDGKIKQEPSGNGMNLPMMSTHQHHGIFLEDNVLTNMELTNILQGTDKSSKRQHKRKANDDLWKSSSSKRKVSDDAELLLETSSSDSTSRSTPLSQETVSEIPTPNSALGFHSDLELSELMGGEDKSGEFDELSDVEEMLKTTQETPTPSVSITPIPTSSPPVYKQNVRSGIEIIPITSPAAVVSPALPSSITITPIVKEEKVKEKKSSKSRSEDKNRLEKKKKRRREEMGPPQDPLTKPVSVSIKPAESPPSPNMMRKFSPSPTQKLSPSMLKTSLKSHHSPKSNSPKHNLISSPKSHGTSPSGGSGKPSMSALKNAANSPSSSKSGGESSTTKTKSLNKDSSREKDKKIPSFVNCSSTKVKTGSVKVKSLDGIVEDGVQEALQSNVIDGNKAAAALMRNRKGNLLAVIDKLKSAQYSDLPADLSSKSSSKQISNKNSDSNRTNLKTGDMKNSSEYMVKPSSDGIKITINKTRTKDGKSLSKSGSSSPKTHTGLKPGVSSGPASKKPTLHLNQKPLNSNFKSSKSNSSSMKSSSSLKSSNRLGSPKMNSTATDLSRKKLNKSNTIFTMKESRKSSPTPNREDGGENYKLPITSSLMMEGLMKQQFDKNFQIPKLSARVNDDKKLKTDTINNVKTSPKLPESKPIETATVTQKTEPIIDTSSSKFIAPAAPKDKNTEILLDFSNKNEQQQQPQQQPQQHQQKVVTNVAPPPYPQSPSVSVHIVKSPAPSPLINPSPHSTSPSCITDDELMDEALVGLGK